MNLQRLVSIALPGLIFLMLPGSLQADTVYTYTGNGYTTCYGSYASSGSTCAGPYALSLTLDVYADAPSLNNLTFSRITGYPAISQYIYSFSATDGTGLTRTQASPDAFISISVDTDPNRDITGWELVVESTVSSPQFNTSTIYLWSANPRFPSSPFVPYNDQTICYPPICGSTLSGGEALTSGTWTMEANVEPNHYLPEPSTFVQLCIGLLGLLVLAARRKRHALPASC